MEKEQYQAPEIQVESFVTEAGFAASGVEGTPNGWDMGNNDWL